MISRRSLDRAEFVQEKIEDSPIKITDIDFETGRLLTYSEALVHQYKFWCRSEADDYVRKPGFAGFFDGYLRAYSMDAEGERKVAEDLLAKTREILEENLSLQNVELKQTYQEDSGKFTLLQSISYLVFQVQEPMSLLQFL